MKKDIRSVLLQILAIILAFIGAMLLVGTLIPLLNPPFWKDVMSRLGDWSLGRYALWYTGGIGLSSCLLTVSWLLNMQIQQRHKGRNPRSSSH
jgi:hypothetical protein